MRCLFGLLIIFCAAGASAEELAGLVVRVIGGDAIVLKDTGHHQREIRLAQIIAPRKGQPWGAKSKLALARMILHKQVIVKVEGKDESGRTMGRIYLQGKDINRAMLDQGEAWVDRQYVTDTSLLMDESDAEEGKLGLFSRPHPVPPWEWSNPGGK